jgi:DNA processing protein
VLAAVSEKPRSESTDTAGPIAVVATGLDVVYPREHHSLWAEVGERGLLLSENPPGTGPLPYRFPLRNRIIAALSEVLLVVESRLDGGSLITVREALDRGVTVMAVPGATSTKAAQGTNMLIRDGALVAIEPEDVLMALGLDTRRIVPSFDARQLPLWPDSDVLDLITTDPLTLNEVARLASEKLAMSFGDVAVSLGRLEAHGWLMCTAGWFERVGAR